jgi:hypothetical protein
MNKMNGVTKDLIGIVGMNEIAQVRLGDIYKVGCMTGNTKSNHIGTMALFQEKAVGGTATVSSKTV